MPLKRLAASASTALVSIAALLVFPYQARPWYRLFRPMLCLRYTPYRRTPPAKSHPPPLLHILRPPARALQAAQPAPPSRSTATLAPSSAIHHPSGPRQCLHMFQQPLHRYLQPIPPARPRPLQLILQIRPRRQPATLSARGALSSLLLPKALRLRLPLIQPSLTQ